jgi:hypothetical protein
MTITDDKQFYGMKCVRVSMCVPKQCDKKVFRCQETRSTVKFLLFPILFIDGFEMFSTLKMKLHIAACHPMFVLTHSVNKSLLPQKKKRKKRKADKFIISDIARIMFNSLCIRQVARKFPFIFSVIEY